MSERHGAKQGNQFLGASHQHTVGQGRGGEASDGERQALVDGELRAIGTVGPHSASRLPHGRIDDNREPGNHHPQHTGQGRAHTHQVLAM